MASRIRSTVPVCGIPNTSALCLVGDNFFFFFFLNPGPCSECSHFLFIKSFKSLFNAPPVAIFVR